MTAAVIVRQDWTGSGSPPGYNVWHCDAQSGSAESDAVGHLVTDLNTFYAALMPFCATNYTWTVADRAYAVPPSTQEYAVSQTAHTGSQGDSSMPPQVALCIGWRTGVRSRSAFGRTFLSGFDLVNIDLDGSPKSALLQAVRDAAAQLISDSSGGTYNLVVYSPKTAVSHSILSGEVKDRWATLRSRN